MQNGIEKARQKYKIEYFNYMDDIRFETAHFLDTDHMNSKGAEKFSRIMHDDFVMKYVTQAAR
jgi:hypothetical protein